MTFGPELSVAREQAYTVEVSLCEHRVWGSREQRSIACQEYKNSIPRSCYERHEGSLQAPCAHVVITLTTETYPHKQSKAVQIPISIHPFQQFIFIGLDLVICTRKVS